MGSYSRFLIDANVFITSSEQYYGFSFCPGFWDLLKLAGAESVAASIDRVKNELMARDDDDDAEPDPLSDWIRNQLDPAFFCSTIENEDVLHMNKQVMLWVKNRTQYTAEAFSTFSRGADPWLIAYAQVYKMTIVTLETNAPLSKSKIKIPDVCEQFAVPCVNTFEMLQSLQHQLVLKKKQSQEA